MENRLEKLRNEIDKIILNEKSDHIRIYSHMYGVARFCALLAMKRNLNVELATTCGMLHDIFYITGGTSDNHAAKGAEQAEAILKTMRLYSDVGSSMTKSKSLLPLFQGIVIKITFTNHMTNY